MLYSLKMSLAFLGFVSAIKIDNELRVLKIDCYERISIGQRLNSDNVYKTFPYKTVGECKKVCSDEKSVCKAFSFGISAKGNATCELSLTAVKETADLKPIGTVADTDFDLYVKKLGCTLVTEDNHHKPTSQTKPDTLGNVNKDSKHPQSNHPTTYLKPTEGDVHNVQTLVSIAHGPDAILDSNHGILVSGNSQNTLPYWYNDYDYYNNFKLDEQYSFSQLNDYYGAFQGYPDVDRYDHDSNDNKIIDRYGEKPSYPVPDRYGSFIPHPDYYYKRPTHEKYPRPYQNPNSAGYYPTRPADDYNPVKRPVDYHYDRPSNLIKRPKPERPESDRYHYDSPKPIQENDFYNSIKRPKPDFNGYDNESPIKPVHENYDLPAYFYNALKRPKPGYDYNPPSRPFHEHYERPESNVYSSVKRPKPERPTFNGYHYDPPTSTSKPKPVSLSLIYEIENTGKPFNTDRLYQDPPKRFNNEPGKGVNNSQSKPIISHSTGSKGEQITSIITEIKDQSCFRRVLAGKRISRGLVRRALSCETVEQCQAECADEKLFSCEGFNYRLDSSGRGKGDCELLSVPLSRIDIYRDSYADPDYDYYERDRNAAVSNCRQRPNYNYHSYNEYNDYDDYRHGIRDREPFPAKNSWADRRYDFNGPRRPVDYREPRPWLEDYYRTPRPVPDRRYDYQPYEFEIRPPGKRRGDYSYLPQTTHFYNERDRIDTRRYSADPLPSLLPPKAVPYDQKPYDSFPIYYYNYESNKHRWGLDAPRYGESSSHHYKPSYYLPPNTDTPDWGLYDKFKNNYSYWGINKYGGGGYLPPDPALKPPDVGNSLVDPKPFEPNGIPNVPDSSLLPIEHRRPTYNYLQDECSLRSVTGFKLHKRIVKKYFTVPNIYECELLCYKEKDFLCGSYAYRYTVTVAEPSDNCYLSDINYKEIDNYTDLEPDRDFDVYTMNNRNMCEQPPIERRESSDCFWRVRSGERLHEKIVRDSLKANSVVECQIECLQSKKFTCRSFSYRYGPHIPGGLIDNCQLTDWPYYELNPKIHFILEPGFEVYERGSYGYGCESGHFHIRGQHQEHKAILNPTQLCYVGFGSPARLLPQAIKKSIRVSSDFECKEECSKARLETLFQCMSFSFRSNNPGTTPNCDLSDIYQRDLLPKLDYVYDPHSLLFAWDNYNPDCVILGDDPLRTNHITSGLYERDYLPHALDTWRVYSVNGWPCKSGARCQENHEAGFWFCELEGGINGAWDYCCRPDHQCGASSGYPYLWCYVGPEKTQWRKCSDRYYPYLPEETRPIDRKYFTPNSQRWRPLRFRPDRRPAPIPIQPPVLSLDQYEMIFNEEFLQAPTPGGIGQPRHWPVSYLHKEMPPNTTDLKLSRMKMEESKYAAIKNLIDTIKNNDLKNIQYQISNESNKNDDILLVKIPLPTNFTKNTEKDSLQSVTVNDEDNLETKRYQKSLLQDTEWSSKTTTSAPDDIKRKPVFRRAFVTRTNVTSHGRRLN